MSRLDELIQELCPDGVEYYLFGDVCKYIRGITYNKHDEINIEDVEGEVVLRANNITLESNTINYDDLKIVRFGVKIKETQRLKRNDILICAGSGSKEHIGKVAFIDADSQYTFGGFMGIIRCNEKKLYPRFLFHIMTGSLFKNHLRKVAGGNSSTINNINNDTWKEWKIPVPPMEVQREIVRVLDHFTLLRQELSAELSARRKQYEYYRDELLTFGDDVPRIEIAKFSELSAGGDVPKGAFSSEMTEEYSIPIISNGIGEKGIYGYTNKSRINTPCVTVAARGAGVGHVTYRDYPYFPIIRLVSVVPNQNVNAKYLSYAMGRINFEPTKGGIPQLTVPMIGKYQVPIPSIEVQEKIVSVLSNFELLNENFETGLPAEIEARTKQYEYYRDKLLSFKRKEAS